MNSLGVEPKILVTEMPSSTRSGADPVRAWRWLGWFSLVLALAGLGDWVLAWIPLRFGSPEWEFGTVAATTAGLPLITMGFAGLLASAAARAHLWQLMSLAVVLLLFAACVLGAFMIFLLDVPIAVRAVEGAARLGMFKAIAKTSLLALLFGTAYVVGGVTAIRHARRLRGR